MIFMIHEMLIKEIIKVLFFFEKAFIKSLKERKNINKKISFMHLIIFYLSKKSLNRFLF